jgi:diaminopimelate epimerase
VHHQPPAAPDQDGIPFLKVHGAGNDFVLIPDLQDRLELTGAHVRALCDRHRGIGGDGVIRLGAPRDPAAADVFMDYRNADGSVAEMCGNGVRTVAKYVADRRSADGGPAGEDRDRVRVDTRAGVKAVLVHRGEDGLVDRCTVDMGAPVPGEVDLRLDLPGGRTVLATTISMGNPHAVVLLGHEGDGGDAGDGDAAAAVARADLVGLGPLVERHPAFPDGTNVEVIAVADRATVHGRIWERGVGETLASGTGGSAMAVAAILHGLADRQVAVHLPGGVLDVRWDERTLTVTGPAVEVGGGTLDAAWWQVAARVPAEAARA